jgi:hypothetical protein
VIVQCRLIVISPPELAAAFAKNNEAAVTKYGGRYLMVSGEVKAMHKDTNWPILKTSVNRQVLCMGSRAQFDSFNGIKIGDKVKMVGRFLKPGILADKTADADIVLDDSKLVTGTKRVTVETADQGELQPPTELTLRRDAATPRSSI